MRSPISFLRGGYDVLSPGLAPTARAPPRRGFYPGRAARGDLDHRAADLDPAAGALRVARAGEPRQVRQPDAADGHRVHRLRPGHARVAPGLLGLVVPGERLRAQQAPR